MIISREKLTVALRKARAVIEHKDLYVLDSNRLPASIDDLRYVVSDMYDIEINIELVDFNSTHLRGMVEFFNGDKKIANVYVKKSQDPEWRRFIAAKELSQLINDEEEDWNPAGVDTIDGLIEAEQFGQASSTSEEEKEEDCAAPSHLQSELLAQAIALEILFPFEIRVDRKAAYDKGDLTLDDLSQQFGIPEYAINWLFSDQYHVAASEVWAEIDSQS